MATYLRIGSRTDTSDIQIQGEVTAYWHEGWIEITSFSFGTDEAASQIQAQNAETEFRRELINQGGDAEGGRPRRRARRPHTPQPTTERAEGSGDDSGSPKSAADRFREKGLTIKKKAGIESPGLLDWTRSGKPMDLQIDCCQASSQPFVRLFVTKARVTSYSQDVDEDEFTESLTLLFEAIDFEALPYGKDQQRLPTKLASTGTVTSVERRHRAPAAQQSGGRGAGQVSERTAAQEATERAAQSLFAGEERPELVQEDRMLSMDDVDGTTFLLAGFAGSEQMSGLFHFRLEVTSTNLQLTAADIIGKPVAFRIEDHADIASERQSPPREFHGIVSEIYLGQKSQDHRDYTLVVVPWLWLLTKRTDCRIFQKKTVVEIVEAVFKNLGFGASDFDTSNVRETYPKLEYCVQYRETDFAFVSRLLEENGIFYFFRFTQGSHKMILADSSVAHADCEQPEVVQSDGAVDEKHVTRWIKHLSHVSGKVRYRDYNHKTPTETLELEASSIVDLPKIDAYELYDYPGRYPDRKDGEQRAKMRMQAEEVGHCIVDGTSTCDAFACGTKFKFAAHENEEEVDVEYVLTSITHRVYLLPDSDVKVRLHYQNEFGCIPKDVTYRPVRSTPRPMIHGPQTALVVGADEIDPDKYGSVKVQFHWDRVGTKNADSSCYVRVAQTVAGKNWGGLWLPRSGQEVVVEFLEGDPDRPLITGCVYNEDNLPPYPLPANKTMSVMKTRSSKDGKAENFNELRFEDKIGSEQVYFHAEKDFQRVVENDDTLTVGKDGKGNQTVTIEKDRTVTLKQGNETYALKKGNREVTLDMGNDTLTVKMGNQTTKLDLGKASTEAMQGIELKVGGNSIKIDPSGITLKGMMVTIEGQVKTDIKGLMCQVTGSAMLKAGGGLTMIG